MIIIIICDGAVTAVTSAGADVAFNAVLVQQRVALRVHTARAKCCLLLRRQLLLVGPLVNRASCREYSRQRCAGSRLDHEATEVVAAAAVTCVPLSVTSCHRRCHVRTPLGSCTRHMDGP